MDEAKVQMVAEVKAFPEGSHDITLKIPKVEHYYGFIDRVLNKRYQIASESAKIRETIFQKGKNLFAIYLSSLSNKQGPLLFLLLFLISTFYPQFPWIRLWVTAQCRGEVMGTQNALKRSSASPKF